MESDSVREAITSAGKRHYAAATAGDAATLEGLIADDVVYTHSNGHRDDRRMYLDRVAAGLYSQLNVEHSPDQIWVFGDIAVVVGTQVNSGKVGTFDWTEPRESVSLDAWRRHDGRWQLIAHQTTIVQPPG